MLPPASLSIQNPDVTTKPHVVSLLGKRMRYCYHLISHDLYTKSQVHMTRKSLRIYNIILLGTPFELAMLQYLKRIIHYVT